MFDVMLSTLIVSMSKSSNFANGRRCMASTFVTGDPLPPPSKGRGPFFIESIDGLFDSRNQIVGYVYSDHDHVVQLVQVGEAMTPSDRWKLGLPAEYNARDRFSLVPYARVTELELRRAPCATGVRRG